MRYLTITLCHTRVNFLNDTKWHLENVHRVSIRIMYLKFGIKNQFSPKNKKIKINYYNYLINYRQLNLS